MIDLWSSSSSLNSFVLNCLKYFNSWKLRFFKLGGGGWCCRCDCRTPSSRANDLDRLLNRTFGTFPHLSSTITSVLIPSFDIRIQEPILFSSWQACTPLSLSLVFPATVSDTSCLFFRQQCFHKHLHESSCFSHNTSSDDTSPFFLSQLFQTHLNAISSGRNLRFQLLSRGHFNWVILMLKELWRGFLDHGTRQSETQLIMHLWSLYVRLHQHLPHTSLLWNSPSQIPRKNLIVEKRSAWLMVPWRSTIQFVTSPSQWPFFFSFEAKFPLAFASSLVTSLRSYGAAWPWLSTNRLFTR